MNIKKPSANDYYTNDGIHSAMREYAKQFSRPDIVVCVEYSDGSIDECFHTFSPTQKIVNYKTIDGETYEQMVDTAKYDGDYLFDFEPMTKKQILQSLPDYINSLGNGDCVVLKVWIKGEDKID